MDSSQPVPATITERTHQWPLFLCGLMLIVLGPVLYVIQFRSKNLVTPWYVPILATVGLVLMVLSVRRRRGVLRLILLVLFAAVCGFEWYTIALAMRSPAYTGPALPGRTLPAFQAKLVDGRPFTQEDLELGTRSVLLFYRGHW